MRVAGIGLLTVALLLPAAAAHAEAPKDESHPGYVRLELALFPTVLEQQIEGPNRDDKLTQGLGLTTQLSAAYMAHPNFEVGLLFQLDAGSVRRAQYGLVGADGTAQVEQLVEGSYWELWTMLLLRGRLGPAFVEVGWAPLILRDDEVRTDLANTDGETTGLFVGSRAVAWMLGAGAAVELVDRLHLTVRLQFRIRYLVERGGKPLAADEETGQMALYPFIGISYAL